MARLSNFHMLCPLINQSSFLGVVNDSSNDCVVVTLGRNIVIRYKISDRKQVGCWSTRDKLSSPVIYDPVGCQYVAVFNRNQIRTWKQNDEDLDTIKKYKFPEEIQCVLVCPGTKAEPVVLFRSGRIYKLSNFLKNKEKILEVWKQQERSGLNSVLRSDETLEDWHMIKCQTETYVLVSARTTNIAKRLIFYLMKLCEDDKEYFLLRRFSLQLPEAWLVGHTVIQQTDNCSLLTLWSNGKIYSLALNLESDVLDDESIQNISERCKVVELISPGSIIDSVKELLDVENDVALVALGPDHLALYGADSGQKGAVVYIVDIHSSVTGDLPWEVLKESAAKQCLKYFNSKEMLPRIWNAAGHLFIPSSDGRLVLASYELGPHPPLADLLGCLGKKKMAVNNNGMVHHHSQLQHVSWLNVGSSVDCSQINITEKPADKVRKFTLEVDMPEKVYVKLKVLIEEGMPESRICSMIFPALMEDGDVESISWCLSHFRDIPEANLVDLLSFFLNQRVATTPSKKEEKIPKKKIASNLEENVLKPISLEGPLKHAATESAAMMNGDVHEPMDTNSCDSLMEDSETKEGFEVGHTFVKGRRRSLRVMKVTTPPKQPQAPKVNSPAKKLGKPEKNDSQEILDMEVERPTNQLKCSENNNRKRNSSIVLNGLGVVQEDNENPKHESSGLEVVVEENVRESISSSSHDDDECIEEKLEGRTSVESLKEATDRPSLSVEKEIVRMALPHGQRKPVEKLLSVPVSSVILLPSLRSNLPFHMALKLLRHLLWLLSSPEPPESTNLSDIQLVEWICHLLDAFYQRYTLSQDEVVLETLAAVKDVVDTQLQVIDALKEMEPLLLQLKSGKTVKGNACDKWYSIENIRLY